MTRRRFLVALFSLATHMLTFVLIFESLEDRHNDQLWRSATNGSESHTSAMDEYSTRQLLCKDVLEALERGNDRDKQVPTPS
jgi:hypothetical protein